MTTILANGTIATSNSYLNYLFANQETLKESFITGKLRPNKLKYFIDDESYISNSASLTDAEIQERLKAFRTEPIYYLAILVKAKDGMNPLERAISTNQIRHVEVMLNAILEIQHFNVSRAIYKHFPKLFSMGIKSFERYLASCYFVTPQMKSLAKLKLKSYKQIRIHRAACVLSSAFFEKYSISNHEQRLQIKQ